MQASEVKTYPLSGREQARNGLRTFPGNTDQTFAIALMLLGAVAAGVQFNDQLIGLTGDNTEYILLGLAFVTRQPYANAEYPWGYPALLSPILTAAGPDNALAAIPLLKLLTIALFVVSLPFVYYVLRRSGSPLLAFVATAFFAINSTTLLYANDVMTEIPYVCAGFGALLFWQRKVQPWLDGRDSPGTPWGYLLIAALLIALPYYLRTVGLALIVAAVVICLLYRRVKEGLALGVVLLIVVLPWLVFSNTAGQGSYLSKLLLRDPYNPALGSVSSAPEFVDRGLQGANLYLNTVFPTMVLPPPTPASVRSLVGPVLSTLLLVGFGLRLLRKRRLADIYALFFFLVLCVWPWKADRFLLPVYPLLLYYALEGLTYIVRLPLGKRESWPALVRGLTVAAVVLFALPNLWLAGTAGAQNLLYLEGKAPASGHTPDWQAYFAACAWLKANTPPDSVVISRKSTITTVFADRPSVLIPLIGPNDYPAFISDRKVKYVLEDAFAWSTQTEQYLRPAIKANPGLFKLVTTVGPVPTRIWQVVGSK